MNLEWSGLVDLEEHPASQEAKVQSAIRTVEEELTIRTVDDQLAPQTVDDVFAPPQTGEEEPLPWYMLDQPIPHMTEEQKAEAAELIQGRYLYCPNVKTFELQVNWRRTNIATPTLLRAFPALETLIMGQIDDQVGSLLARILEEYCPNVHSLKMTHLEFEEYENPTIFEDEGMAHVVNACVALARWEFDDTFRNALMAHRDWLEVLELTLFIDAKPGELKNIRTVLEGCTRLKKFSMRNCRRSYKVEDASVLLDGLKDCCELESLSLVGFPFIDTSLRNIHGEMRRIEQYNEDMKGEKIVSMVDLPTGWRYLDKIVVGANESQSTGEFRRLGFEGVAGLPLVKTLILNSDWFVKDLNNAPSSIV